MDEEELKTRLREEREASIRELEARVHRPRRIGVRWTTALVAIVLGLMGLFWMRQDVAYFFSPREPITLGAEGDYHFDRLKPNRYAQIHGTPVQQAAFSRESDATWVHVALQNTPIMVRRGALPTEDWVPGRSVPPPDQRPFGIRGRLLPRDQAQRYEEGFKIAEKQPSVSTGAGPLWVLIEGENPGRFTGDLAIASLLVAFIALNAWMAVRDIADRRRARAG